MSAKLEGSMVAVVTPMLSDGSIDLAALRSLIDWHVSEGTNAIVVAGTTGESATLRSGTGSGTPVVPDESVSHRFGGNGNRMPQSLRSCT